MSLARGSGAIPFSVLLALTTLSSSLLAQRPGDAKRAETLFQEGKKLLEQGKVDSACPKLKESFDIDPAVGTLGMLARCNELQGHRALAWRQYVRTAELAKNAGQEKRQQVARELATNLEKTLALVRINVLNEVPGLVITRSGETVPEAEWGKAIPADPGSLEIKARAPGRLSWSKTIEIPKTHETIEVEVPLLKKEKAAPPPSQTSSEPEPSPAPSAESTASSQGKSKVPAVVVLGLGAVGLGVGGFFGLRAFSKNSDSKNYCNDAQQCTAQGGELRDDARSAATISTIAFGAGVAAIGVGIVLLVASGSSSEEKAARVWIAPQAAAGQAGLGLGGRF